MLSANFNRKEQLRQRAVPCYSTAFLCLLFDASPLYGQLVNGVVMVLAMHSSCHWQMWWMTFHWWPCEMLSFHCVLEKQFFRTLLGYLCIWQRWKWVIFRDPWPMWPITQLTHEGHDPHDPWPTTSFHPTHGTRRQHGMVVLDNPLDLDSKKNVD